MALKEKALRRLSDKFHARSIPFALGGEYMMHQRGLLTEWHQFDVYVSRAFWDQASALLSRLGMKSSEHTEESWCEGCFHFDGADITLHAGLPSAGGISLEIPDSGLEETDVFGSAVPLMPLADWYAICLITKDSRNLAVLGGSCPDTAQLACIRGAASVSDLKNI